MWMEELFKIKCLVDQKKKKRGDLLWAPNYIEIEKIWTLNKTIHYDSYKWWFLIFEKYNWLNLE